MGTKFFIAVGVLPVELIKPTKFQGSQLHTDQDSSIYILDVILG